MGDRVELLEPALSTRQIPTEATFRRCFLNHGSEVYHRPIALRITLSASTPTYLLETISAAADRLNRLLQVPVDSVKGVVDLMLAFLPQNVNLASLTLELMRTLRTSQPEKVPINALFEAMQRARRIDNDWGVFDYSFGGRRLSVKFRGETLENAEIAIHTPVGWQTIQAGDIGAVLEPP
jgi:hypothetical protein